MKTKQEERQHKRKKSKGTRVKIRMEGYTERCGERKDNRQKRLNTESGREGHRELIKYFSRSGISTD